MEDQYKNICKTLKIGYWVANSSIKRISIDTNLCELFNLSSSEFSFSQILELVCTQHRNKVKNALDSLPSIPAQKANVKLEIGGSSYWVEIILETDRIPDNTDQISGYLKIASIEKLQNTSKEFNDLLSVLNFTNIGYCKWDILSKCGSALEKWFLNMGENSDADIDHILSNYDKIHPQDRAILAESFDGILAGTSKFAQHEIRVRKDNTYVWIYYAVNVTKYAPQHNILELSSINADITHYKEIEQDLNNSKKEIGKLLANRDLILNNLSSGLVYIDNDYVVQWESMSVLSDLFDENSYKQGEICYRTMYNRDSPCEECPLKKMKQSKASEFIQIERYGVMLELVANPVFDQNNKLLGGVIRLEDKTKHEQNERKIKELNNITDSILNNIPVLVFVKNPNDEFRYLYWNKAVASHTMIPTEKAIGKTDNEIFSNKTDVARFLEDDMRLLKKGGSIEYEEMFHSADGTTHTAHTMKILIPNEETLPWLMGVSWDITDLKNKEAELVKAKEKAEESDRFKSSFLANMSHEIRTPLNAIVGFSELLIDEDTEQESRKEYLAIIQKNNKLLLQLISDILDLSRIEARGVGFNYGIININMLCSRVVTVCSIHPEVIVPITFDTTLPEYNIYSDENRVQQVITNFVTNAMKFTSQGSIELSYKLLSDVELEISVTDSGIGIPADKIDSIFERFEKLNSFVQGTGLGLSICKNLVEQFGGRIGVDSKYGTGSRFWFTLPYDKV